MRVDIGNCHQPKLPRLSIQETAADWPCMRRISAEIAVGMSRLDLSEDTPLT